MQHSHFLCIPRACLEYTRNVYISYAFQVFHRILMKHADCQVGVFANDDLLYWIFFSDKIRIYRNNTFSTTKFTLCYLMKSVTLKCLISPVLFRVTADFLCSAINCKREMSGNLLSSNCEIIPMTYVTWVYGQPFWVQTSKTEIYNINITCLRKFDSNSFKMYFTIWIIILGAKLRELEPLMHQICCFSEHCHPLYNYMQLSTAANSGVLCAVMFTERYRTTSGNLIYCVTEIYHILKLYFLLHILL